MKRITYNIIPGRSMCKDWEALEVAWYVWGIPSHSVNQWGRSKDRTTQGSPRVSGYKNGGDEFHSYSDWFKDGIHTFNCTNPWSK